MLQPKRTKYRKTQKGRNRGLAYAGGDVSFGQFGLKAVTRGQINAREIEAARRAFTRAINREGQVYIRVFPAPCSPERFSSSLAVFLRKRLAELSLLPLPNSQFRPLS